MVHRLIQILVFVVLCASINSSEIKQLCDFVDVSEPIASVLCSVESGRWYISKTSNAVLNAGCLLGSNRCKGVAHIPTEKEVPASPPPPDAKVKAYQALALKAEAVVPSTWWRKGFADHAFLLTHNDSELPRKQFDAIPLSSKKLKNIVQCVTKQQFIRKSLEFDSLTDVVPKCTAMNEIVVTTFLDLWKKENGNMGGEWIKTDSTSSLVWFPRASDDGKLLLSAMEVVEHFVKNYGGIWTGCHRLENAPNCRGALAAASLVASMNIIADIAGRQKTFTESNFVRGYLFATLGRGLLHGDMATSGNKDITRWGVRCADFVALQGAYLKLYTDTFGALYKEQLDKYIPMSFPPSFEVHSKPQWQHLAQSFEPVYTSLRNWMFTEVNSLIDFGPYRPLVAFQEVREKILAKPNRRRVLIDVGANGFFASPKYLLDSYAPYLPFTHAVMIEPEPHFSATVPKVYSDRYNISFLQIYAEVATGTSTDMLVLLPKLVTKDDFVVLKFDVDPNRYAQGPTMEWGFLFSIMSRPEIAQLVDEIYIELHFHFPSLQWAHYHSNWEALDALRYLRSKGAIVHAWP